MGHIPDPREMIKLLKPMLAPLREMGVERLRAAQEDPSTAFVTVVGGEALIDYERCFEIVMGFDALEGLDGP